MSSFDAWVAYLDTLPPRPLSAVQMQQISALPVEGQEMVYALIRHGSTDPLPFQGRRIPNGGGAVWAMAHLSPLIQSRIWHALDAYTTATAVTAEPSKRPS